MFVNWVIWTTPAPIVQVPAPVVQSQKTVTIFVPSLLMQYASEGNDVISASIVCTATTPSPVVSILKDPCVRVPVGMEISFTITI